MNLGRKCRPHGRRWCRNCAIATIGFPVEHFIWEKLPLFRNLTALLGL